MTDLATAAPADLLVELHRLGVRATVHGDGLRLRPASRIPPALLEALRAAKADVMALLADPRRRWPAQALALTATVDDADRREDLTDTFGERRAIASVEGELDEDAAGALAYRTLVEELTRHGG